MSNAQRQPQLWRSQTPTIRSSQELSDPDEMEEMEEFEERPSKISKRADGKGHTEPPRAYEAIVIGLIYRKPQTSWGVVRVRLADEIACAKGSVMPVALGSWIRLEGWWEDCEQWGRLLRVWSMREYVPVDPEGMTRYLLSLRLNRLTPPRCEQIVERFGRYSLEVIEQTPERMKELDWSDDMIMRVHRAFRRKMPSRSLLAAPDTWGLNLEQAEQLIRHHGNRTLDLLRRDPYRLLCEAGLSFSLAEQVANRLGLQSQDPRRLRAAIQSILRDAAENEGHTALPRQELLARTRSRRLQLDPQAAIFTLSRMEDEQLLCSDPDELLLGLPELVEEERAIARGLWKLNRQQPERELHEAGDDLNAEQAEAIRQVQHHRCMILTGGPGTGKTYTVRSILSLGWKQPILAAPTGKAAKRLTELTGMPAWTLHRLLEYNPTDRRFGRNAETPLEADLIVVDEAAMLDIPLMAALIRAVDVEKTTLVLCGDANQLPSVGPGNLLMDLINTKMLPVVQLKQVVRQHEKNQIIPNAQRILEGTPILVNNKQYVDFKYFSVDAFTQVAERKNLVDALHQIFSRLRKDGYAAEEIQVLCPMKKGDIPGAYALNEVLQKLLSPGLRGRSIGSGAQRFFLGDRVIQLRNDYEREVFNGDTGVVVQVGAGIKVRYEQRIVSYDAASLGDLELSYAISIHKSQGSEWPVVILPLSLSHKQMLSRRLLYTAMTRAQKLLILVGDERAVAHAVTSNDDEGRITTLSEWCRTLQTIR
ncbi:MAG: AAA family ATPase [Myxococcales bacterium]|nr:AAA family ATPase [Myxococcales bacterium]